MRNHQIQILHLLHLLRQTVACHHREVSNQVGRPSSSTTALQLLALGFWARVEINKEDEASIAAALRDLIADVRRQPTYL